MRMEVEEDEEREELLIIQRMKSIREGGRGKSD